jgi:hypothetical protein
LRTQPKPILGSLQLAFSLHDNAKPKAAAQRQLSEIEFESQHFIHASLDGGS